MNANDLLKAAFDWHKRHPGVIRGSNFVECVACRFHVHAGTDCLYKHWKGNEYDRTPITDPEDVRLR